MHFSLFILFLYPIITTLAPGHHTWTFLLSRHWQGSVTPVQDLCIGILWTYHSSVVLSCTKFRINLQNSWLLTPRYWHFERNVSNIFLNQKTEKVKCFFSSIFCNFSHFLSLNSLICQYLICITDGELAGYVDIYSTNPTLILIFTTQIQIQSKTQSQLNRHDPQLQPINSLKSS